MRYLRWSWADSCTTELAQHSHILSFGPRQDSPSKEPAPKRNNAFTGCLTNRNYTAGSQKMADGAGWCYKDMKAEDGVVRSSCATPHSHILLCQAQLWHLCCFFSPLLLPCCSCSSTEANLCGWARAGGAPRGVPAPQSDTGMGSSHSLHCSPHYQMCFHSICFPLSIFTVKTKALKAKIRS